MFSGEYWEMSKSNYFKEHLCTADSEMTDRRNWFFRTFFLESRFQNHPYLVMLQKYQSLLDHSPF